MNDSHFDLIIRGGSVHDGDGSPSVVADVAVKDGVIVMVGTVAETGRQEFDATGMEVTPGFVDIHTHYDGQAIWSDQLAPSSWHGVTTAVMGNCGVGFAPCRADDRKRLVALMEGVEDIPEAVMAAGLSWDWESFPEYLDAVEKTPRDIDLCALLPHAPLRAYVMGERAFRLEPATPEDIAQMRELVSEAIAAGAWGVSTSRNMNHKSLAGDFTPTLLARERELLALNEGMSDAGRGLFEILNEIGDPQVMGEYSMVRRILEKTGRPGIFSLTQSGAEQNLWRDTMEFADQAMSDGVYLRPVAAPRAVGFLLGLEGSQHPLKGTRAYHEIEHLPLAERVAIMRDPEFRSRMIADDPAEFNTFAHLSKIAYSKMYRLGRVPNFVPNPADSVAGIAEREGRAPVEVLYDLLLEDDGRAFIYVPSANFLSGDLRVVEEMLANQNVIMGLGDGGAHLGFILDANFPTFLLTYWVKERGVMSLPEAIRRLTSDTADVMGLKDRGRIQVGLRADLNIIDMNALELLTPFAQTDLPNGGKRLLGRASGYVATIVNGEVTYRNGEQTGARPGRLVRSAA